MTRMTESVVFSVQEAAALFARHPEKALERLELGDEPQAVLSRANQEMGLALAEDEIRYLIRHYLGLGQIPTDVELMMFAQANSRALPAQDIQRLLGHR